MQGLARPGLSGSQTARLRALLAMTLGATGEYDRADAAARQALAEAEQAGDRRAAGYALHASSRVSYHRREWAAPEEYNERALSLVEMDPQATDLRLLLLANKSARLRNQDRPAEAIAAAQQALALAERAGTPRGHRARVALASLHFEAGERDDALAELDHAPSAARPVNLRLVIHGLVALIAGHRGDREIAPRPLRAVDDENLSVAVSHGLSMDHRLAREPACEPD